MSLNKSTPKTGKKALIIASSSEISVSSLTSALEKKMETIREIETTIYRVPEEKAFRGLDQEYKLKDIQNSDLLAEMAGYILRRKTAYDEGQKFLGKDSFKTLEIDGYKADDWLQSIELRNRVIQNEELKKEIKEIQDAINAEMDKTDRLKKIALRLQSL